MLEAKNNNLLYHNIFVAIFALAYGATILLASSLPTKWHVGIILAMLVLIVSLIVKDKKLFFILLFTISIPINADTQFQSFPHHLGGAKGLSLSLCDIFLFILLIILLFEISTKKNFDFRFYPKISLPILGILFFYILSLINSVNYSLSLYEIIYYIKMYIIFICMANIINNKRYLRLIITVMILGVLLESSIVLAQHTTRSTLGLEVLGEVRYSVIYEQFGGLDIIRTGGTIGHPNRLAMYLVFLLPLPVSLILLESKIFEKMFYILVTIVGMVTLVFTLSRAAWISFGVALFCVFFLRFKMNKRGFSLIIITILLIFIIIYMFIEPIKVRLFENDYGSARGRIPSMQVAINIINKHPLVGIGINNYTEVMGEYDNTSARISWYDPHAVHNLYLLIAAESGIPSLFLFLIILYVALNQCWKNIFIQDKYLSAISIGIFGGFVAFIINYTVDWIQIAEYTIFWFLIAIIMAIDSSRRLKEYA